MNTLKIIAFISTTWAILLFLVGIVLDINHISDNIFYYLVRWPFLLSLTIAIISFMLYINIAIIKGV